MINSELEKQDRENESLVKQELERQEKKTAAGSSDVSGPCEDSFAGQVFDMHQEMIDLLRKNEKDDLDRDVPEEPSPRTYNLNMSIVKEEMDEDSNQDTFKNREHEAPKQYQPY